MLFLSLLFFFFFFQAEDGIRDFCLSRGLGDVYKRQGPTCLAGDIIGDYSFKEPLKPGDKITFCDMAIYTTVKNNTFNGINLPSIVLRHQNGDTELIKTFGYQDFKSRL